jgi:CRP-like cAMP-binding protein
MATPITQTSTGNALLDMLPDGERTGAVAAARAIQLVPHDEIYMPNSRIADAYFPTEGVISLLSPLEDGKWVETAVVGNEGVVGLRIFLGSGRSGNERAVGQVRGTALRMGADSFRELLADSQGKLAELMFAYTEALMGQMAQSVVCNAVHTVEERCARWMLQVHDRVRGDDFGLTQEFLAEMLAVRRPSVTVAAGVLHKAGLISYHRGFVNILDRQGLEHASCECYANVKAVYASAMAR